ncbi:MAG TPA: RNA polymerase sigma-70 factor [Sphingobacteriaceae bacterium]
MLFDKKLGERVTAFESNPIIFFNTFSKNDYTALSPENKKKFEQLFKELFSPLTGYSMKYIYDLDDAKNIVHEVFLAVWEKFESLPEGTNYKSYLYTSVKNKSLNFIRDKKKHVILEEAEDQGPVEENLTLETAELEKEIEIALQLLPEKCRQVFEMNRQDGLKYAEIAEKLNISIKTVEAQMSKALAIMREHLRDFLVVLFFLLFG